MASLTSADVGAVDCANEMERVIYTPPTGPPQGPGPSNEIYALMGEANIFEMISDLYKELEKSEVRHLFPADMEEASKKSAAFFVTVLGGPPLYFQKYGPPRMRARHLPFEIDERARQIWLGCFERVLEGAETKYNFPPQHLGGFREFLQGFSAWMVNKA
jgi:hemoglobin